MTFPKKLGYFPKVGFSAQKEDTRAILLKTALVRVSCIQIIQVRDQTTAKVFEKVDTFWTYQPLTQLTNPPPAHKGDTLYVHACVNQEAVGYKIVASHIYSPSNSRNWL